MLMASDFSLDSLSVSVRLHTNLPDVLSGSTQKKPIRSNWNLQSATWKVMHLVRLYIPQVMHKSAQLNYLSPGLASARCVLAMQPLKIA